MFRLKSDHCFILRARPSGVFFFLLGASSGAWAQSGGPADHASIVRPAEELQEVIVTAQRRAENIQQVPLSVQAIDQQLLAQTGVRDLEDISLFAPGVDFVGYQPGNTVIIIRGISPIGGSPTTALYVDDVPITGILSQGQFADSPDPQIDDTERVEVLKGPQGTLYGDSAMGGAVKFIGTRPDARAFSAHANVEAAATEDAAGSQRVSGTLNIPLVADRLALRTSATYRYDGGYIDNVSLVTHQVAAHNVDAFTATAFKAAIAFTPDDTLSIVPEVLYQHDHTADRPYAMAPVPGNFPAAPGYSTAYLGPFEKQTFFPEPTTDTFTLSAVTIDKRVGPVDFKSITGYFTRTDDLTTDLTPFVLGVLQHAPFYPGFQGTLSASYNRDQTRQFTQEIRLASADAGARFKWTLGGFYSNQSYPETQTVFSAGLTDNLGRIFGPGTTLKTFVPGALPSDEVFVADSKFELREFALFGEGVYNVTDALKITIGARAYQLRQRPQDTADGFFDGGPSQSHPPTATFQGVDPRFVVSYQVAPDNFIYASASKGFRPGTVNAAIPASLCAGDLAKLGLTGTPTAAAPDTLWNYEVGSKNEFLAGRLRINAAAYEMIWSGIQLTVNLPTCQFSFEDNVGTARIRGGEFSIDGKPLSGLTVGMTFNYTDAAITKVIPDVLYRVGDEVPFAPRYTAAAYGEYTRPISGNLLGFARMDYTRQGPGVRDASANSTLPWYRETPWDTANVNIGADWSKWEARLFVRNAFDHDSPQDWYNGWGLWRVHPMRPRTIGINLGMKF